MKFFESFKAQDDVRAVARDYLCNTCGACSSVCPTDAVSYRESVGGYLFPWVDEYKCKKCGFCLKVCPGVHFGRTLNAQWPSDPFVGEGRECFVGRAAESEIWAGAQSGGVVTALLVHALRHKILQGATVTAMTPGRPPKVGPIVATTEQEVMAARKSKYVPVPLLKALKEVEERNLAVAVVGLPCHLHGLQNLLDVRPELEKLVPLRIGLICDRIMTMVGMGFLAAHSGLEGELRELRFRDKLEGGWPGNVKVISTAGRSAVVSSRVRLGIKELFTPVRCRLCFDKMNVFADITVGDPWGIPSADMVNGECVVITRTCAGSELVKAAIDHAAVVLRPIRYEEVIKGQKIEERRRDWKGYCEAWEALGGKLPDYYTRLADYTSGLTKKSNYMRYLRASVLLDRFRSREELLRYIGRRLFLQECRRWLFFPVRLARGVLRRIWRFARRAGVLNKDVPRGAQNDQ